MRTANHLVLLAASRFYMPLIALLSFSVLMTRAPGGGAGFLAGIIFGVGLAVHLLVFGAAAASRAFPPWIARALLALGLIACTVGMAPIDAAVAGRVLEGGVFVVTTAALSLILTVVGGRAPTLRDEAR